jgi:hypothetical protein
MLADGHDGFRERPGIRATLRASAAASSARLRLRCELPPLVAEGDQ